MKKTILVAAITTIVINAIMLLMLHFCPICDTCRGEGETCKKDSVECCSKTDDANCCANKGTTDCCSKSNHPGCSHADMEKCSGHGDKSFHSMDALKSERAEFDNLLSDEEKAEIAKAREALAGVDHKEMGSEAIAEKYAAEFAAIQAIADKYNAEIDAVFAAKHGEMMPDDMNHGDISEEDMAEMMIKFKMHFLTMEF